MSKPRIEYRIFTSEVRAKKGDKPQIAGHAAVFNTPTDLGYVREQIAPGAFTKAIADKQDVKCLFNHDPNKVLGRTKSGTLRLKEDNTGLHYECDIDPDTTIGKDVHAHISRGDVDQCSFGFVVRDEEMNYDQDDKPMRTIKQADLFDVSPVTYPAYPTTSVEARSNELALRKFKGADEDPDADSEDDSDDSDAEDNNTGDAACACRCRACFDGDCRECDMHINDCQADNCDHEPADDVEPTDDDAERSKELRAEAKTLTVDGEVLTAGAFLYVGNPDKTSTWALPWKFSSAAKTKSHLRNALARFDQTKTIPAAEKAGVYKKLVAKCKTYGIDVDDETKSVEIDVETAKRRTYLASLTK